MNISSGGVVCVALSDNIMEKIIVADTTEFIRSTIILGLLLSLLIQVVIERITKIQIGKTSANDDHKFANV